jgi:hypothetical protein
MARPVVLARGTRRPADVAAARRVALAEEPVHVHRELRDGPRHERRHLELRWLWHQALQLVHPPHHRCYLARAKAVVSAPKMRPDLAWPHGVAARGGGANNQAMLGQVLELLHRAAAAQRWWRWWWRRW